QLTLAGKVQIAQPQLAAKRARHREAENARGKGTQGKCEGLRRVARERQRAAHGFAQQQADGHGQAPCPSNSSASRAAARLARVISVTCGLAPRLVGGLLPSITYRPCQPCTRWFGSHTPCAGSAARRAVPSGW